MYVLPKQFLSYGQLSVCGFMALTWRGIVFQEIPPFETKPVMRASFVGRIENNHTAFIRIKTNRDKKDEVLILPVEV